MNNYDDFYMSDFLLVVLKSHKTQLKKCILKSYEF